MMVIALDPYIQYDESITKTYPLPPAFSMDKLGIEQPGKGQVYEVFQQNEFIPNYPDTATRRQGMHTQPDV